MKTSDKGDEFGHCFEDYYLEYVNLNSSDFSENGHVKITVGSKSVLIP